MTKSPVHKKATPAKASRHKKTRATPGHTPVKTRKSLGNDEYDETHRVTKGEWKGFQGTRKTDNEFHLLKNARGAMMRNALVVELPDDEIEELDHFDSIALTEDNGGGEENADLIEHEEGSWECPKCKASNRNDAGYCSNTIDGKWCGATPACVTMLSWEDCFAFSNDSESVWKCGICTTKSPVENNFCIACETARETQ